MFGRITNAFGALAAGKPGALVKAPTPGQVFDLLGPPPAPSNGTRNQIASQLWAGGQPYARPGDLDAFGRETPRDRREYRVQFACCPVLRAAVRGKADDISCMEPTVLAADKDDAESADAARFVKWTVSQQPRGWRGLFSDMFTAGSIDGFAVLEKTRQLTTWGGRKVWGLAQCRSLDTGFLGLKLDQFNNVLSVVNLIRGIEPYSPDDVILYSHNPLYNSPFGQSDLRAVTRASQMIEDVYKVWYVALKVYGLPYMVGRVKSPVKRKEMEAALEALRAGGYIALGEGDDVEILNLAAGAALTGFEAMVQNQRENIFYGVRGASLPFKEGQGASGAHGNTEVEQGSSDANEVATAKDLVDAVNRQLVKFLVEPNFDLTEDRYPVVKLGGTDWEKTKTIVDIFTAAKALGARPSAEAFHDLTNIPSESDDEDDRLETPEERQQRAQQAQQAAAPPQPAGGPAAQPGGPPAAAPKQLPPTAPEPEPEPPAATFSADHRPDAGPSPEQVAAVAARIIEELAA